MKWFNKRKQEDLSFVDISRKVYHQYPVQKAADVTPLARAKQTADGGKYMFPHCPGMIDYAKLGYIIPAWTDIRIMANKAGIVVDIGSPHRGDRGFRKAERMGSEIINGFFTPEDGVPLEAMKVESPWYLFANGNTSAILAPPLYHADWMKDLHTWVGCVDYEHFPVTNFIFSPKRECIVHIKAGEPLLHVIPFNNMPISAGVGPGTQEQVDKAENTIPGDDSQFYRKFQAVKKVFSLKSEEE